VRWGRSPAETVAGASSRGGGEEMGQAEARGGQDRCVSAKFFRAGGGRWIKGPDTMGI
jgi:hypothetical protein